MLEQPAPSVWSAARRQPGTEKCCPANRAHLSGRVRSFLPGNLIQGLRVVPTKNYGMDSVKPRSYVGTARTRSRYRLERKILRRIRRLDVGRRESPDDPGPLPPYAALRERDVGPFLTSASDQPDDTRCWRAGRRSVQREVSSAPLASAVSAGKARGTVRTRVESRPRAIGTVDPLSLPRIKRRRRLLPDHHDGVKVVRPRFGDELA